jgi:translation initiation factor IF-2
MTNSIDDGVQQANDNGASEEEYEVELLEIPTAITVHDLADLMMTTPVEVIKEFMRAGNMYSINDVVEHDVVSTIADAFGFKVMPLEGERGLASIVLSMEEEDPSQLEERPPVVTILGHVDHGKTTLLDTIRKTDVVSGEAGGITQHIAAYQVKSDGHVITFLDTPGHAAFTAMRARGAQVTDVAVLVVAADDGIMPQTEEAISHVKAAGVPIVVAINKIDRPDADTERVKRQLAEHDLLIEEWGGDVIAAPVSALTGDGVADLLEQLIVVSEVGELKANPNALAIGVVIEARRDKSRGTETTILVQNGTLKTGDNIVVGAMRGRIRAMFNDHGESIQTAGPSQPVEILGMNGLPEAGLIFEVVSDEKEARQIVEFRQRASEIQKASGPTLEDVHTRIESGEVKALNLIVKTDVQGSVEAIKSGLSTLNTDRARVNLVHAASGSITESDILLAVASQAIVVGFNSTPEQAAQAFANQEGVEIRHYSIIYNLLDDVELALTGLLEPVYRDVIEGQATVRAIFKVGRRMEVAGFFVNEGRIARDSTVHVMRGGEELFVGSLNSLKHFKDDVREVANGLEGGLMIDGFHNYEEGDILQAHRSERVS